MTTRNLLKDVNGAAAVEFAIYSTLFFAMLFGSIYASILGYTSVSLNGAVESAARCRSLGVTCTDSATTITYAASKFHDLAGVTPTFTSDTAACGNRVSARASFKLNWIISSSTIPLSATACFP